MAPKSFRVTKGAGKSEPKTSFGKKKQPPNRSTVPMTHPFCFEDPNDFSALEIDDPRAPLR